MHEVRSPAEGLGSPFGHAPSIGEAGDPEVTDGPPVIGAIPVGSPGALGPDWTETPVVLVADEGSFARVPLPPQATSETTAESPMTAKASVVCMQGCVAKTWPHKPFLLRTKAQSGGDFS